jgi:hypothetical protein
MRIRALGDHSAFHSGSAAVWSVLCDRIERCGHERVEGDEFDLLLVNGEGTMHHGGRQFHAKMTALREALEGGRRGMLVNSVWQQNPRDFDDVLPRLDAIVLRDDLSRRDLLERHGVHATTAIDLSFFRDVGEGPGSRDFAGRIAVTDLFSRELESFVAFSRGPLASADYVDLAAMDWDDLVRSLRSAKVLVTGRHHGVYAAAKARTPFVAFEGNTHKIAGLLRMAGVEIPLETSARQIERKIDRALRNEVEFARLFDWMGRQDLAGAIPIPMAAEE